MREVELPKNTPLLLAIVEDDDHGEEVPCEPLRWLDSMGRNLPLLTSQAQRVLAIAASQAQSDHLFPSTRLILTEEFNSLSADSAESLISPLRKSWAAMDPSKKFSQAAQAHPGTAWSDVSLCSLLMWRLSGSLVSYDSVRRA